MANKTNREEKVRNQRLLQILECIRTENYPNSTKLKNKFETSRSTIMRDIEFLKDRYNAPIEYCSKNNGYYLTDPNFVIQSILLTEGELFAVHTILPLMEQYKNTPLENTFKSIISKMIESLPNQVEVDSSMNRNHIHFIKDPLPNIDEEIFNSVFTAIKKSNTIKFDYRSISKQEYTTREFDPYKVLCQKGNWYVIGYCHLHNHFIVYSLSRMKNLSITKKRFSIKTNFDINKFIDPDFGIWLSDNQPQKIELIFDKSINTYILERTWHINQECYQNKDGSVYLSFMSNQIPETLHWVMSFGSHVKVLNPPELLSLVKDEIKKMKKVY